MHHLQIRIHEQEYSKLQRIAKANDQSMAAVVRNLIRTANELKAPKGVTHEGLIQGIAKLYGQAISLEEANWILWERTGYPEFFDNDLHPARQLLNQVCDHLENPKSDDEIFKPLEPHAQETDQT